MVLPDPRRRKAGDACRRPSGQPAIACRSLISRYTGFRPATPPDRIHGKATRGHRHRPGPRRCRPRPEPGRDVRGWQHPGEPDDRPGLRIRRDDAGVRQLAHGHQAAERLPVAAAAVQPHGHRARDPAPAGRDRRALPGGRGHAGPRGHRFRPVELFRLPGTRNRRGQHASLQCAAHRGADVRRPDDHQRARAPCMWRRSGRSFSSTATSRTWTRSWNRRSAERSARQLDRGEQAQA